MKNEGGQVVVMQSGQPMIDGTNGTTDGTNGLTVTVMVDATRPAGNPYILQTGQQLTAAEQDILRAGFMAGLKTGFRQSTVNLALQGAIREGARITLDGDK